MAEVEVPVKLLAFADRGEDWGRWLDSLPSLVRALLSDWDLRPDGASMHGECALVVPVRTADDVPAALKIGWPHEDAENEHLALRSWAGRGAATLLRADPHRTALLLERLDPTDLMTIPVDDACEVIAGLYGDLHVPASPAFRTLSSMCERWTPRLEALLTSGALPRRYVERAAALTRDLAGDPATNGTIIHTDLHYFNVLRAERRFDAVRAAHHPWLAIDPKPLSGDPAYEVAPLLWNRWDEAVASGDFRTALRRRFETVVDAAGLDEDRARAWVVVRMIVNAMWEVEEPSPDSDEKDDWLTDCVTIVKAIDA